MGFPYRSEYAKSGRSHCRGCRSLIDKDELRLAVMVQSPMFDGTTPNWYHEMCFFSWQRPRTVDEIAHFESLRWDDQEKIRAKVGAGTSGNKRAAAPKKVTLSDFVIEYSRSSQAVCRGCRQKIMKGEIRVAKKDSWHHLACFTKLKSELGYNESADKLPGFMTLKTEDQQEVIKQLPSIKQEEVLVKKAKTGDETDSGSSQEGEMKTQNILMFKYRDQLKDLPKKDLQLLLETNDQQFPTGIDRMLDRLSDIMTFGALKPCKECKHGQFVFNKLGYICQGNLTQWTKCDVITRKPKRRPFLVPVELSEKYSFLEEYKYVKRTRIIKDVNSTVAGPLFNRGNNLYTRHPSSSSYNWKSASRSMFTSSMPSRVKLTLKGGNAVDPDSGLEDCTRVYQNGNDKYTAVLGLTDIQRQKNSFYKLQLLQADSGNRYWVFRSWGRIGTTIGGNKTEEMGLHEAKREFCRLYEEKSGNNWNNRDDFVKVPGRMYPIDIDYGEDEIEIKLNVDSDIPSKLKKPVQELVQLIFDVNNMKKLMLEFELDTEKMPLGKLSKSQLQSAYSVLTELQRLVESNASLARLIDASNRFYTFVPHSFGMDDPPVIDDLETIKKKIEMVENLIEIEIAYNLMKSTSSNKTIDNHYDQLKTEIDTLDFESEEFNVIKEYVKNTHAATHSNYELEIKDVFTIKRQGEEERYKPFCKLHNRKLLWHGSRTTNFAGILSQGLRIAPPEAPVTGYMFGKGVYFADMVSKSANYCCTNPSNNTGLLLLCEVALGEMHELYCSKYIEQLPMGKHSVKGVGKTEPDPQAVAKIHGDVLVPIGKGVTNNTNRPRASDLLYNEYIVYDEAQVNIKYLIKMDFKYKY